jgi:carboxymethylenebutenolidase
MCFDLDSRPPIPPIAGGALDSERVTLTAADGNRLAAFRARPAEPTGAGIVILPDVRGLHPFYEELALRFAERGVEAVAIDWFGRTASSAERGEAFEYMPHVSATTWGGIATDIGAGVAALRAVHGDRAAATAIYTIGFCMGGRMSYLAGTLGLGLAGVIGLYGTVVGPWRNDAPAPIDVAGQIDSPVLAIFGGADAGITPDHVAAFERALDAADVVHEVVTYPGAPHSFFDRKAAEFADASADAWSRIIGFVGSTTGTGRSG